MYFIWYRTETVQPPLPLNQDVIPNPSCHPRGHGHQQLYLNHQPLWTIQTTRLHHKLCPAQLPAQSNQRLGNRKPFLDICQRCNIKGHFLSQCRTFGQQHSGIPSPPRDSPQLNTATVDIPQTNFLVDSEATHHITNDIANMAIHHPYTGPDSLFMDNSSGLNISHSKTLLINDLSMKQQIISVSQLTKQTNFIVLFMWRTYRQTKQLTTHKGSCVNGLYRWPAPAPIVHTIRKDSPTSWHHKLGHPSSSIFKFIFQHISLGTNKFQLFDCNSCQISKSHKLHYYCMFVDHFAR